MKRLISLILCLILALNLAPAAVSAEGYADAELARAVALGFGAYRADNPAVTYAEFFAMLDRTVELADASKLAAWRAALPEARRSADKINRFNGMVTIMYVATVLGEKYLSFNADWGALNDKIGIPWDKCIEDDFLADFSAKPVEKKGFESTTYVFDWGYGALAYFYGMGRASLGTNKTIFDYDANKNSMRPEEPLAYSEALLASLRLYDSAFDFSLTEGAEGKTIRAEVEKRKSAILNSKTTVAVSGTKYYVSNSGDDKNDGKSEKTAWNTIDKVNAADLKPNDGVFFERGGLWRTTGLVCQQGVTYSAYGTGDKPKIYGSPENGTGENKWSLVAGTKNIWVFYTDIQDCGGILLGDSVVADKQVAYWNGEQYLDVGYFAFFKNEKEKAALLSNAKKFDVKRLDNLHFFNDIHYAGENYYSREGKLYLRCDAGNPGKVYNSIEFFTGFKNDENCSAIVWLAEDCVVDNLCFRFGVGAIYFGVNDAAYNESVQNCEIGYVGGTMWMGYTGHNFGGDNFSGLVVRSGDGLGMSGKNNKVVNCYIYEVWDSAITLEAEYEYNNSVEGCVLENCSDGVLVGNWNNQDSNEPLYQNLDIKDNYIIDMGSYGWKHKYAKSAGFSVGVANAPGNRNIRFTGNILFNSQSDGWSDQLIFVQNLTNQIVFDGNTYLSPYWSNFLMVEKTARNEFGYFMPTETVYYKYDDNIKKTLSDILGDKTAVIFTQSFAPILTATPTSAKVTVNGNQIDFDAYTINGQTYYQIADIARSIRGTAKQFSAKMENGAIYITRGTEMPGEISKKGSGNKTPVPTKAKIYIDGAEAAITAYTMDGHTYYQMKAVAEAFDFAVGFANGTITVNTNAGFAL
jgi:hypothetical protein